QIAGVFTLATPTDLSDDNPTSGLWFAKTDGQKLTDIGLKLPKAPAGWAYEGQMIFKDQVIAMGRFTSGDSKDDFQRCTPHPGRIPPYPGADYLEGGPSRLGLEFPTDLASGDWQVLVTLEPDNHGLDPSGDGSFYLRLLEAKIAQNTKPLTEMSL